MRLTPEVIHVSPQFTNAIKEKEIDLRNNNIPFIENLGATRDQFDSIDLSDNEIQAIDNFPQLLRLQTIYLSNNRIETINGELLSKNIPELRRLILTNNFLREVHHLYPLCFLKKLECLSLVDNLVTKKPNYRLCVIFLIPSLKNLDFQKVKLKERKAAKAMFQHVDLEKLKKIFSKAGSISSISPQILNELDKQFLQVPADALAAAVAAAPDNVDVATTTSEKTFEPGHLEAQPKPAAGLTDEQKQKLKTAIKAAKSQKEVDYYIEHLKIQKMPDEFL